MGRLSQKHRLNICARSTIYNSMLFWNFFWTLFSGDPPESHFRVQTTTQPSHWYVAYVFSFKSIPSLTPCQHPHNTNLFNLHNPLYESLGRVGTSSLFQGCECPWRPSKYPSSLSQTLTNLQHVLHATRFEQF